MKKSIVFLIILLLACASAAHAKKRVYGHAYVSRIVSVYDGDTIRCDIEGLPPIVGKNIGVRLYGIDTPEMRDKRPKIKALAIKARDYVRKRLSKAKTIELRRMRRGKYFRVVAEVYVDGSDIGQELFDLGLAHKYYGKTKVKW